MHGAPTDPTHAAPPTDTAQIGHGCVGFPVSTVAELSEKFHVAAPVPVSSVPVGGAENVFVTHTDNPRFEIGSGSPNGHPVFVQSTPAGVDPELVAPMLHVLPVHPDNVNRLVAPPGVELSGTCESPPPSDRFPHKRFFNTVTAPTSRNVLPQFPLPAVDKKSNSNEVEVDVLDDVEVDDVVELEVLVELVDVVDEVLVELVVELEVDVLDVELVEVDDVVDDDVDVLLVDEVLVELVVDDDVEVLLELEVDVLDVELVEVDDVVDDDVDVLLVDEVLVDDVVEELVLVDVVVWFGLHTSGMAPNSGTPAASMQSVL